MVFEHNDKDPKFKIRDHMRISKYKNIFANGYILNWSDEVFVNKKVKNTVLWAYVISDLNDKDIIGICYNKELQTINQTEFTVKKVIKRKGGRVYVKL